MAEPATKRLTLLSLLILLPAMGLLSWWSWQGLEDNLASEAHRIRRFEELAASQVVNNLGSELFHLEYTFNQGVTDAVENGANDWPRVLESVVGTYKAQAHYPGLLADVVLVVDPPVGPRRWVHWSSDGWIPGDKPAWISPSMTLFDAPADPVIDLESPVMLFALPQWKEFRQVLVVRYSVDEVLKTIVPALADQAFAGRGAEAAYDVQVVRQATGPGADDGEYKDLTMPLVPRVRFAEWLHNYLDRTLDLPRGPQERYMVGSRWALTSNLKPGGLAAYVDQVRHRNLAGIGALLAILALGFGMALVSIRRLYRASERERAFSSLVSHELKTPLAAIRSLSENLADGVVADPVRVKEYGDELLSQTARLGGMVSNILSLALLNSPGRALVLEVFDLGTLAQEAGTRSGLAVGMEPGPWRVHGNRAAVGAALDNLVTNALKYGVREGQPPLVALGLHRSVRWGRRWAGVSVTDHGPGLGKDALRDLFRPYRRGRQADLKQSPGGGIGLTLVRATLKHLGGRVKVHQVPGGGLSFVLWLKEAQA